MNKEEVTLFAKTNFRNQETAFGIKTDDRRRHMYIVGKTGMGKTNLLENMAIQDIRNGYGVAYIDPHGDTAEKLIKSIPPNRINDVVYFNPSDQDFPIAFNVMEKVDAKYRHLVASGLVGVFKKIWADSWGPRLEYILRNAIMALLEYPGSTLLGVTRILVDKKYRERIVEKVTDPVVKMFWTEEFTKWNDRTLQEVISPIQNKVGQFLSSALIRNIIGQTASSFDVREIMDDKKILIMNLSKGRIGEDASALMGAMMITKLQLAAMSRVDIEEETRNDFFLYVDEFQNFATESFANILSEARKYRLSLILANQYITQIDEKVRDAIFGNAGTLISFRVGAMDAEFLEKEMTPVFLAADLVNLPKFNIYLKLMIDGIAGDAFSATTLPPVSILETAQNEEKVIRISRERYASSREEVEEKINRWSGMLPNLPERTVEKNFAPRPVSQLPQFSTPMIKVVKPVTSVYSTPVASPVLQEAQSVQTAPVVERQIFETKCDTCGTDIQVPFAPDGKRPTFCKDCLKDYQRALAKTKLHEEQKAQWAQKKTELRQSQTEIENIVVVEKPQPRKIVTQKVYAPQEAPMSLSQMQHIAPKKFKPQKHQPNLSAIRNIIQNNRAN